MMKQQTVLLTHGDSIEKLGANLTVAALSENKIVAAIYNESLKIYGVQFHPEVDLTRKGKQMLYNFLIEICGLAPSFTMFCRKEGCIKYIRDKVSDKKVIVSWVTYLTGKIFAVGKISLTIFPFYFVHSY